jgi:F-type H+-transporting ATPase subunit a
LWNLLEAFLLFVRDDIVRPSIGGHHEEEHGEGHMPQHGHAHGDPYGEHGGRGHDDALAHHHGSHGGQHVAAAHGHGDDVTRLVPLFWTIFFFVLGCNLFGMLPWLGAPSASFSVTTGLALVTLVVGMYAGIKKFGFLGHLGNQIPSMDLPWYIAFLVKPLVYAIEVLGLMIKHGVLAIRLLANMVAGHLVILGIMGVAFGASAAAAFNEAPLWQWSTAAVIAVVASTLFSLLELFVAFLQAYIFTFLSALFIGAALHRH